MMKESFWKPRKMVGGLLGPLVVLAVLPAPANAYPRPGLTERVSVGSGGTQGDRDSYTPSISADGRYVAFGSFANLVPGDKKNTADVMISDRKTGTTELVSVGVGGEQPNGWSYNPSVSADGSVVAFWSFAKNLAPGGTNGKAHVFVRDRETGSTEQASVATSGAQANLDSHFPSVSADGRYVAFFSLASNLVTGDNNGAYDVFVHDRETGVTERVSVGAGGAQGDNNSHYPVLSSDGRYVAFSSFASNLVAGDTNLLQDVFVHDRETGVTERVSVGSDGAGGEDESTFPAISADGRHIAFQSRASNLVPGDANGTYDVFVHDRETGTTERVSVVDNGTEGNNESWAPSVSADGRYVAFGSYATNLVPADTNGRADAFVHDRETGATERISVGARGTEGNAHSTQGPLRMSADGRYVAFYSYATNLISGDTNAVPDVFVYDRGLPVGLGEISAVPEGDRVSVSGWATFSGAVAASSADPAGDGTFQGRDVGADLVRASFTYRPEDEDLLVRLRLASLPRPLVGGSPAVLYGLRFRLGNVSYEVRALRAGATAGSPEAPHFFLYRCDPGCAELAKLSGGVGTTGEEVRVSVPLSVLAAQEGTPILGARAFTGVGEAATGVLVPLDQVDLSDTAIPTRRVSLGMAPAGTPEAGVAFDTETPLAGGSFSGTLVAPSADSGNYEVWARICLGEECTAASTPIRLGYEVPLDWAQPGYEGTVTPTAPGAGVRQEGVTNGFFEFDVLAGYDNARMEALTVSGRPADIDLFLQRKLANGTWSADLYGGASFSPQQELLRAPRLEPGRYRVEVHNFAGTPLTEVELTITFFDQWDQPGQPATGS